MACMRSRFCSTASPVRVSDIDDGSIEYCIVAIGRKAETFFRFRSGSFEAEKVEFHEAIVRVQDGAVHAGRVIRNRMDLRASLLQETQP